ncbi:MAG TPA: leucyl aminopeptidase [Planctomycetes bacterium]|nr:leucyl aminopeptidase [Planctomycetota bacterium]
MRISSKTGALKTARTDLLVCLFVKGETPQVPPAFEAALKAAKTAGDIPAKFQGSRLLYPSGRSMSKRLLLLCAGESKKLDNERLRRLAGVAANKGIALKATSLLLHPSERVCKGRDGTQLGLALGEGLQMGAYRYQPPSKEKAKPVSLRDAGVLCPEKGAPKGLTAAVSRGAKRGAAVCFARDLGNKPGNLLTPRKLAAEAKKLAGGKIRFKALDEKQMAEKKMGAILAVSQGSREPARMIFLDYNPGNAKKTICVVGKGLTFDAGGISLKPGAGMWDMRYDMCGSAAVLGLFHAIKSGACKPKHRIIGVVPTSENLPGGEAIKPGDVVRACDGTTIEIQNTDAEGRLILCDALAYSKKTYKPDAIVDLATLTGAVIIALGHEIAAAIGNDDKWVQEALAAGESSGDSLWQLPLRDFHRDQMKSKFADLKNINQGRAEGGGTISGAAFLSYFVGDTPWVHLDIAGTAWNQKAKGYYSGGATGFGVRLLADLLG